jgi:hypothetical protein
VSTDPAGHPTDRPGGAQSAPASPSEEELRAAYEAELSRITSADMMLQAAVSLLNIGGRRLGLVAERPPGGPAGAGTDTEPSPGAGERDLDQVRDAIDGVRALLPILERRGGAEQLAPLRDALAQLQMAYARELQGGATQTGGSEPAGDAQGGEGGGPAEGEEATQAGSGEPAPGGAPDDESRRPGPAESSGRLWIPGSG